MNAAIIATARMTAKIAIAVRVRCGACMFDLAQGGVASVDVGWIAVAAALPGRPGGFEKPNKDAVIGSDYRGAV
jgi:hypothetical protein